MNGIKEIQFFCVFCGISLNADIQLAGKTCKCPNCVRIAPVPTAPFDLPTQWSPTYPIDIFCVEVKFPCPKCGARLVADAKNSGDTVHCPGCQSTIRCPSFQFLTQSEQQPDPAAKKEAPRTVIHLTREEIEFLGKLESAPGTTARHAT